MYAVRDSKDTQRRLKPNILPCKINYDGPVNADERYWRPERLGEENLAYFRGRKLTGKEIKVPEGYEGAVLRMTNDVSKSTALPRNNEADVEEDDDDDEQDTSAETKIAEKLATFDEVMLWSHEAMPDVGEDPYMKGISEWMAFAQAIHSHDDEAVATQAKAA